jgi:hypothetical protein
MYKIGICGKAKSGKNTTASIILEELAAIEGKKSLLSETIAFADPIKEIILKMFPTARKSCLFGASELRSNVIGPNLFDLDGLPLTYRQALIDIGSNARKYSPNIWVDCFDKKYQQIINNDLNQSQKTEIIIVPDLRFKEEFDYLKQNNYFLIKINRDDVTKINHDSETAQEKFKSSDFNFILNNDEDISQLRKYVKNGIIPILSKKSSI